MTFLQYIDAMEHLIGAYRVGALSEVELLRSVVDNDLECDELAHERLEVAFNRCLAAERAALAETVKTPPPGLEPM
jgi:hypothetical protein